VPRVGVVLRAGGPASQGGDLVQARAIGRFLSSIGAEVCFGQSRGFRPSGWDVAIIFNLSLIPETAMVVDVLNHYGTPYVVFPVFWDLAAAIPRTEARRLSRLFPAGSSRRSALRRLSVASAEFGGGRSPGRGARPFVLPSLNLMRRIVDGALAICPNSQAEMVHLGSYLGLSPDERWVVVRNGIWSGDFPEAVSWERRRGEVLCVGGLSPRKNSWTLVRAAKESGVPLRMIGTNPSSLDSYGRRVLSAAGGNTRLEAPRSHQEILDLLSTTKAHVQVGFVETPGLATLEAVGAGAAAVVARTPVVVEYLPDGVLDVDPNSIRSIAAGLVASLTTPPPDDLAERIRAQYDWSSVLRPLGRILGLLP